MFCSCWGRNASKDTKKTRSQKSRRTRRHTCSHGGSVLLVSKPMRLRRTAELTFSLKRTVKQSRSQTSRHNQDQQGREGGCRKAVSTGQGWSYLVEAVTSLPQKCTAEVNS